MEILKKITDKLIEHENIVNMLTEDLDKLSKEVYNLPKTTSNQSKLKLLLINKVVLKDKMIFHKAAVEVLKDLKKELENE